MMIYEKPAVEIVAIENENIFTASSGRTYNSPAEALSYTCGGYNGGATNNFSCSDFGGYNATNPPKQNTQVTIAGTTYVFDYKGNHWKLHK